MTVRFLFLQKPFRSFAIPVAFLVLRAEVLPLRRAAEGGDDVEVVEGVGRVLKLQLRCDPREARFNRLLGGFVRLTDRVVCLNQAQDAGAGHRMSVPAVTSRDVGPAAAFQLSAYV